LNNNNILVSIGALDTAWPSKGCNRNFAIVISDSTLASVFRMCNQFDNLNIHVGPYNLYDGAFHQICVTYNNTESKLCVYLDSQTPNCLVRQNPPYNTTLGDVRIGWWPDNNRQFVASGGGSIHSVSLFDSVLPETCITDQFMNMS